MHSITPIGSGPGLVTPTKENRQGAVNTKAAYKYIPAPIFSYRRKTGKKLTATQKAIKQLARPLVVDREYEFMPFVGSCLLIGGCGATDIVDFPDDVALHYFLVWLRAERKKVQANRKARDAAIIRRRGFKLVVGAE
jgi:hypothetical protein